jgi:predicted protein tyrosine phosphatase
MTAVEAKQSRLPFSLAICGVSELDSKISRFTPSHIVSITDPGDDEIQFAPEMPVLRLSFFDVHAELRKVGGKPVRQKVDDIPSIRHAEAIIEFGRGMPAGSKVLIHCWAGISRSTAAAFLLICMHRPGDEYSAFQFLKALRPQAQPNRLIVKYADKLLNAGGRMLAAIGE